MARIVISLSGEGRGHAARTLALLDMLQDEHQCLIFSPSNILPMLREATQQLTNVCLRGLPYLRFKYNRHGNLCYLRSWAYAVPFITTLGANLRALRAQVESFGADLAITDFEPLLPRVARRLQLPLLSLDHQHFLYLLDTQQLSVPLRARVRFLRPSIKLFCPTADRHLVSSFYSYPQRAGTRDYEQVGVLIRKEFGRMAVENGDYLLIYVRRAAGAGWLEELSQCGVPCKVYGLDRDGVYKNIEFCRIDAYQFMQDLAGCRALLTTAGNQLVGEALVMGKPILAMPEPGNFEQEINGYFLAQSGLGECLSPRRFDARSLKAFLSRADHYREVAADYDCIGNQHVLNRINSMLPPARPGLPFTTEIVSHQEVA